MNKLLVWCMLMNVLLSFNVANCCAKSKSTNDKKQAVFTVEITKKDGKKMTVTNFRIENRSDKQDLHVTMYSNNIEVHVPLIIIRRITNANDELTLLLGDNSTVKGHCEVGFAFDSDLGKEGIGFGDIKELVFKQQAIPSYAASPHGKHQALLYLKNGKKIKLTGATFLAAKFDRNPKYRYPVEIGDEYPKSVHFEGENSSTFYDLTWEQIKSIVPLDERRGVVDSKIITQTGRELVAWANYWWTADRIQGIVLLGNYQLLLTIRYSAAPMSDYERIELL